MPSDARISTALPRHPKLLKLQRKLGTAGCWSLLCLILWTADNRPSGDLRDMTHEDLELASDWTGEAGAFARALLDVGFLDSSADGIRVHDWADHQPWIINRDARVQKAITAATARWSKPQACSGHAHSNAPTFTQPNQNHARSARSQERRAPRRYLNASD